MLDYFNTLEKIVVNKEEFWVLHWITPAIAQAIRCGDIQGGSHFAYVCVVIVK